MKEWLLTVLGGTLMPGALCSASNTGAAGEVTRLADGRSLLLLRLLLLK